MNVNQFFRISSFIFCSLFLYSCGPILKILGGLNDPKVYSQEEIEANIARLPKHPNIVDAQLQSGLEEEEIKSFLYMSIPFDTYIYNADDKLLCFKGETSCGSYELQELENSTIEDKYDLCDNLSLNTLFEDYLGDFEDIISKTSLKSSQQFSDFKHKVLVVMNTDISKNEIIDDWNYIFKSLNHNENVVFIRIWTDLNENWGLEKDKKAKFKVRKVKGEREVEIILSDLPYVD